VGLGTGVICIGDRRGRGEKFVKDMGMIGGDRPEKGGVKLVKYTGLVGFSHSLDPYVKSNTPQRANNESSEVFDIIKPGRRVKIKGHRQLNVNNF